MSGLENKVVVVTGGSNGIGAATVNLFLTKGAKVASFDIQESTSPSTDTYLPVKCNIGSESDVNSAVKQATDKWGTVDILVNNAGVMDSMEPIGGVSLETWKRCHDVNLHGPFHLIRACLPFMEANEGPTKGSIVNVGSNASVRGGTAGVAYTASKHALLGLSRSTSWMYRHKGIRCNAVLPGGVNTNIMQNSKQTPDMSQTGPYLNCMPAMVEPEDVANAILNIATSSGMNGAEVAVDMGWTTV